MGIMGRMSDFVGIDIDFVGFGILGKLFTLRRMRGYNSITIERIFTEPIAQVDSNDLKAIS